MYKEIGNSIYGTIVRGISEKQKFDNKTGTFITMPAHRMSNPIIASWITGFIRSIIGECLHFIQTIGGLIVSVTTDGFITNVFELENKLNNSNNEFKIVLFRIFQELRTEISGDSTGLETKNSGTGIISWSTRGQLGINSFIKAATGFQSRNYSHVELVELFSEIMIGGDKSIEYMQSSLRSPLKIVKTGGHVTMTYNDQKFSLKYDNRRIILEPELYKSIDDNIVIHQQQQTLLDSKPYNTALECKVARTISNTLKMNKYNRITTGGSRKMYKNYTDLAVKNLIKGIICENPLYPELASVLDTYTKIIEFITGYDSSIKLSKQSISNLRNRKVIFKQIPRNDETLKFIMYVKKHFPVFDESKFFQK